LADKGTNFGTQKENTPYIEKADAFANESIEKLKKPTQF
jgi:hypothetical protein